MQSTRLRGYRSTRLQLTIREVHVCGAIEAQDYSYQYAKYTFAKLDNNRITATNVQSTPLQSCSGTDLQQQICKVTFAALHNNTNTCPDYSYKSAKYMFAEVYKHVQSTRLRSCRSAELLLEICKVHACGAVPATNVQIILLQH